MAKLSEHFPVYRIFLLLLTGWFIWSQQFIGGTEISAEAYSRVGAPYAFEIYQGAFWGLFTNSFVHIYFWHFATSLLLLAIFGKAVEDLVGKIRFIWICISGLVFTSAIQLAMTGDPGVGCSGVNAVFMGYLLHPKFRKSLRILFWVDMILVGGSLLLMGINLFFDFIPIALSAILVGYWFGFALSLFHNKQFLQASIGALMVLISFASLIYNPYSSEWHTVKGYTEFEQKEWGLARWHYKQALRIYPNNHVARTNLRTLTLAEYKEKAYQSHLSENYKDAIFYYEKVLELEPQNEWATNNLKTLK